MDAYWIPIRTALAVFPLLAAFLTFPYMIYQYRRYGAIPFLRTVILYSFLLYLLCMYFLVILPLPSIEAVAGQTGPTVQLLPFQFVRDFIRETKLDIMNPKTYLPALTQNCFLQVICNMVMFLPLGMYLRYYFRCGWGKTAVISFLVSLFFEFTQLSGLYGIYPRGYRLFDVDDLMLNTWGGMLGYAAAPLLAKLLPSREQLDQRAYLKGRGVTFCRRFAAFLLDWLLIGILLIMCMIAVPFLLPALIVVPGIIYALVIAGYFILIPWATDGYTPGKWICRIRITGKNERKPALYQYALRYGLLYFVLIPLPVIWVCGYIFEICTGYRERPRLLLHERISRTECVSTVGTITKDKQKHEKIWLLPA